MENTHHEDYRHFRDALFTDLTQNLKPVIISLTMLAEDYCRSDTYIAKAIEEYIDEVSSNIKILGLYLIDSIMKNFKTNTSYIKIFERNIVPLFERVFKAVDENNRKALYKLRQTWLDLFSVETLYDLDVRIQKVDPAWPITAVIPPYEPTVVKQIVKEPPIVKKIEPVPPKPVNVPLKKSLFEIELSKPKTTAKPIQPVVKKNPQVTQNKSPVKPTITNNNVINKSKVIQKNSSPGKTDKSPETVKNTNSNKPIIKPAAKQTEKKHVNNPTSGSSTQNNGSSNSKKLKLSPTASDKIDKTPPKKPIQKSPNFEQKKEKPIETQMTKSVSITSLKHPISDKNETKPDNVKRIKLSDFQKKNAEKETPIEESSKDVDLRFMLPSSVVVAAPIVEQIKPLPEPVNISNLVKNILDNPAAKQILNNRTNKDQVVKEHEPPQKKDVPQELPKIATPPPAPTPSPPPVAIQHPVVPQMENLAIDEKQDEDDLTDLPPIKPKDVSENSNDSLLIIDGRSYRIQPDVRRTIKIYYHDHDVYCDTKTKDIFVDQKRVAKMGDNTKEIMLNGRRVRLMYMGKRIELWIDGMSFHFRADSPPKQITLSSSMNSQSKRYFVTIDSRTMDMYFNSFKVCTINGGPYGNGPSILMARLAPDDYEQHEVSFVCPPKRIMIDGIPRKMRYDLPVPCIEMDNGQFHIIRFTGPPKDIHIDSQPYKVPFDKTVRIKLNGRAHELAWGGPGFEVIIDGRPYELQFNKPEREIIIGTRPHSVCIYGEAPDVKICGRLPKELCEKAQQTELKPIAVKPPPLMSQPLPTPTDPSILRAAEELNPKSKISNLQDLLQQLVKHNILPKGPQEKKEDDVQVPDLTSFDMDLLKQKYTSAFKSLYRGVQCKECGNRFNRNETSNGLSSSRYSKHLDWHYRQNKKEKEELNKAHSRSWYYTLKDWVLFEEISEEQVVSTDGQILEEDTVREHANEPMVTDEPQNRSLFANNGIKTCPATDDIGDSCCICNDPFEIFWYAEKEEWHFKDAIRVDNRIYHPICYEDNREENEANQNSINDSINTSVKSEPI